ncbi:MAG: histidine phosphatase family protein [Bacilli bacterium]|nr:histidine phosphatase family protein [Bacilli bacterium]
MKIYIVRHGETDFNKSRILQGRKDVPLNQDGLRLAEITGEALRGIHFDEAYSSPLIRSTETIKIILSKSGNNDAGFYLDKDLVEVDVGDWTLANLGDESNPSIEDIRQFFKDPFSSPGAPGGESVQQVIDRTQAFIKKLASRNADKTYLVGTHGFAMRAMLNFLYEDKRDFWHGKVPYNCCFNILEVKDGKISLIEEDVCYYKGEKKDYYGK